MVPLIPGVNADDGRLRPADVGDAQLKRSVVANWQPPRCQESIQQPSKDDGDQRSNDDDQTAVDRWLLVVFGDIERGTIRGLCG